ncbi:MAG: histidine phosphatase family protein [Lachnospiraceae bacterium]|nr:histidine phosphatase family protein [Lachnospiraceae bacterium]
MKLIFVRHGEPDYAHDCLTDNGKVQAECAAKRLKKEGITAIYASPMGRAVETASYTAREYGLEVQKLDFMHEINWGDKVQGNNDAINVSMSSLQERTAIDQNYEKLPYGGHPWTLGYKYLIDRSEGLTHDDWDEHHYFKDNVCMDYFEMISSNIDELLGKYGLERKNDLYYCTKENNEKIALFAHGGSGAILFAHILNLPFPFVVTTLPYGVCSVSIFDFGSKQGKMVIPRLELFNDMGHIEQLKFEPLHFEK